MQKQFIALTLASSAVLPLACQAADFKVGANTNITVSGLLAVGAKSATVTDSSRAVQRETRFDDNTSRLIVSGNTELAFGLKGIFRVESRFTADVRPGTPLVPGGAGTVSTGTGWADGDTWIGMAGGFGSVYFGKSALYYTDTLAVPNLGVKGAGESYRIWDINGLGVFNLLSAVGTKGGNFTTLGITRAQNVVRYDTPVVNKVDGSFAYTKNASGDENHLGCAGCGADYASGGTWYGRLRYNDGPLTASLSLFNSDVQGGVVTAPYVGPLDKTGYRAGVAYSFPVGLKLGLVYDNTKVENGIPGLAADARRGAYSLPLSYTWGDSAAYLTYTRAGSTSNLDRSGATQWNLGYDFAFAKNVFVGAFLTQLKNDANGSYTPFLAGTALGATTPRTGEGYRQVSVDINYWF